MRASAQLPRWAMRSWATARARAAAAIALLGLAAGPLRAATPAAAAQAPDDAAVSARLGKIAAALDAGEDNAMLWWNGWLGIFAGSSVGSVALSYTAQTSVDQHVWQIGALRSSLGVLSVLFVPCPAAHGPASLRAMPESTPAERLAKLRAAEQTLRAAADAEVLGRSWFAHVSSLAVNVAFSAWVWAGYHKPASAAISFGTGLLASEAKIFTTPTRAVEDAAELLGEQVPRSPLKEVEGAEKSAGRSLVQQPSWQLALAPLPGGLLLAASF